MDSVVQAIDAVVSQLVHRAADGRRQQQELLVLLLGCTGRRGSVHNGHQSRVEVGQTGADVHRLDGEHVERPVVDRHVRPARQSVAVQQAIDVERQELHALGQDQLAGRRRRGAIFAIASQNLGAPINQSVPVFKRGVEFQINDSMKSMAV